MARRMVTTTDHRRRRRHPLHQATMVRQGTRRKGKLAHQSLADHLLRSPRSLTKAHITEAATAHVVVVAEAVHGEPAFLAAAQDRTVVQTPAASIP